MKKAIGYVRVSTEAQALDGKFGVENQVQEIENWAKANGYQIVDWKIDKVSGASDNRPMLNTILYGDISNPPFEAVIVWKSDRLARDTKLYFYYLFLLEKKGIKLHSVVENFDEDEGFANVMRAMVQFVAEQERKNIALRTGKGRELKAKCGGYAGGKVPYGYDVENGNYVINESEAVVVREIFRMHSKGKSFRGISITLNEMGQKTRSGGEFYPYTISRVVNNEPLYRGMYRYGEMDWTQGQHEAILD